MMFKEMKYGGNKKVIKILHLYSSLMNLYGDWANAAVLTRAVKARGFEAILETCDTGCQSDISSYSVIIIGSGTELSQRACIKDIKRHEGELRKHIEDGGIVLATGNSHELFGNAITDRSGNRNEALGFINFETVQLNTRVTGDCLFTAPFINDKLIGFINRAGGEQSGDISQRRERVVKGNNAGEQTLSEQSDAAQRPFKLEPGQGAGFGPCYEGIRYKNFLGTYVTGPILVRNPPLLRYFTDIICAGADAHEVNGADGTSSIEARRESDLFFKHQEEGYQKALRSMTSLSND